MLPERGAVRARQKRGAGSRARASSSTRSADEVGSVGRARDGRGRSPAPPVFLAILQRMSPLPQAAPEIDRPLGGLVKHSAIYSAAPILRQVISIGMTRLYTAWLQGPGFGVKEIVDLWLIALQQLLGQNVLAGMVRFYFEQKDPAERARVVTSCTLLVTALALVVSALGLLFVPQLTPLLLGQGEQVTHGQLVRICQLLLILVPFQLATLSGLYYLQILQRSALYTAIQTAKLLFEIAMTCWLIGARGLGVEGFLLSILAGEVLTASGLCGWMLWTLRPRIEWRLLAPILRYAGPLIPVGLSQLALHRLSHRLILEFSAFGSAQALTGVFGLGYRISYLVTTMMLGPFIQIWQPWIFGIEDSAERGRLVARVSTYAVLAVAGASLGVILFGRQAAMILAGDPVFWQAYRMIPFVTAGYVFWALYHVSQTPLLLAKRTGKLVGINLISVALNFGLNAWLIPLQGIVGAAIAALVTFAALAGMGMLASHREAGVTFELGRLGRALACVLVGGAFALWIDGREDAGECPLWLALASKALALGVLLAILWFSVLRADERARFASWISARRGVARSGQPG